MNETQMREDLDEMTQRRMRALAWLQSDKSNEIINVSLFNKSASPDPNDIADGALQGILMLQNTYTLKTDQFRKGAARSQLVDYSNPIPAIKMEGKESLQASISLISCFIWLTYG